MYYDIWALLGNQRVLDFLAGHEAVSVLTDCIRVPQEFLPDLAPPDAASPRARRLTRSRTTPILLRAEHRKAMQARLLDVRVDDFGGPYDAVLADAVLLHVTREQFVDVLQRARHAVASGGVLAITLKEGDGEAWTEAKLGRPRHFTYWREPAVHAALMATGWQVLSLEHVAGRDEPWLFVIARTGQVPSKIRRHPV